jgi:hypothetical protein
MIDISVIGLLIDWTMIGFEFYILSITYPTLGVFRTDSLLVVSYREKKWYLEVFFNVWIGEKILSD